MTLQNNKVAPIKTSLTIIPVQNGFILQNNDSARSAYDEESFNSRWVFNDAEHMAQHIADFYKTEVKIKGNTDESAK